MLAVNEFAKPSLTSIVAIDAVLPSTRHRPVRRFRFRRNGLRASCAPWAIRQGGRRRSTSCCREWRAPATGLRRSRSIWGLTKRKSGSGPRRWGLLSLTEKPLRRPTSANPWSVEHVRLLIALWLDNVSAASIAATLGRSPSSIHSKRRWLGLGVRDRKRLQERPVAQCRATALPWKPTFDVSAIVARLMSPRPGILTVVHKIDPLGVPVEVKWAWPGRKGEVVWLRVRAAWGGGGAEMSARAIPGRGQMGAWPGQGKGRAVFGSRLRGLESPGDREAHAGRVRRAPDGFGGQQPNFAPADRSRTSRHDQRMRRRSRRAPRR